MHGNEGNHLLATDSLDECLAHPGIAKTTFRPATSARSIGYIDISGGLANDLKIHRFVYRFAMSCSSRLVWRLFSLCRAMCMMCLLYNIKLRSLQTFIDIASRSLLSFFPNLQHYAV
jgi:hypothetical protein